MSTATLNKNNPIPLIVTHEKEVQGRTKYMDERSTTMQVKIYSWREVFRAFLD